MKDFKGWLIEKGWDVEELSGGRLLYQFRDKDNWKHEFLVKEDTAGHVMYSFVSIFRNGWSPFRETSFSLLKNRCREIMNQPSINGLSLTMNFL